MVGPTVTGKPRVATTRKNEVRSSNEYFKDWGHSLTRIVESNLDQSKVSYKLALVAIQVHLCKPELAERPVRRKAVGSKSGTASRKG